MVTAETSLGPVELLCKEIGYRFDRRMETSRIFVDFVSVLVEEIASERETQVTISKIGDLETTTTPSEESMQVLSQVRTMLREPSRERLIDQAARCHDFIRTAAPEGKLPTDHLIDMLSSCVSAIRFGLEQPCRSRHAAEASNHVWRQRYGLRLHDGLSAEWGNSWAREQMTVALLNLALHRWS